MQIGPSQYSNDTQIFALANASGGFACFAQLATAEQRVFAFTSVEKAKDFLRVMRSRDLLKGIDRLFPCTLAEWFEWQPKKKWPDLTIDADPHEIADYPLNVTFDPERENVHCATQQLANGTAYTVWTSPRSNRND